MERSLFSEIKDERLLLSQYTDALRSLLVTQLNNTLDRQLVRKEVERLAKFGLWELSEIAHALLACNCQLLGLKYPHLQIYQLPSGAVPLFERLSFVWGKLPYPRYHAELGALLVLLAQKGGDEAYLEIARKMGEWQLGMLDHRGLPICGCWYQEEGHSYQDLLLANYFLFNTLSFASVAKPLMDRLEQLPKSDSLLAKLAFNSIKNQKIFVLSEPREVIFETPHFIRRYTKQSTLIGFGSGCKSIMGLFLHQEGGVVGFGPSHLPLGDFSRFGIESDPQTMKKGGFNCECVMEGDELKCHFVARLAGAKRRPSGHSEFISEGFSGIWVEGTHRIRGDEFTISCQFNGVAPLNQLRFLFFARGKGISVSRLHHLKPCSLDRYVGPSTDVIIELEKSEMSLTALCGSKCMEIIPLSDDETFFSATFLIAYTLEGAYHTWTLAINEGEYHS
ncbi:MAG: hypothetical protein KDK55_03475 [Chlamydiia bacterium]|nr:hypothetical protein [Chlamydiia bacterium]